MARRAKKTSVFLIVDDSVQRNIRATDLRAAGFTVHDYTTAREFLNEQRHHSGGVFVADYRLLGMSGLELAG